jgi:hypothetical protein
MDADKRRWRRSPGKKDGEGFLSVDQLRRFGSIWKLNYENNLYRFIARPNNGRMLYLPL